MQVLHVLLKNKSSILYIRGLRQAAIKLFIDFISKIPELSQSTAPFDQRLAYCLNKLSYLLKIHRDHLECLRGLIRPERALFPSLLMCVYLDVISRKCVQYMLT